MKELFDDHIKTVISYYESIFESHDFDAVLIHSGVYRYTFLDDRNYPFVANPHFKYFLPLNDLPNSFIYLHRHKKPQLFYYQVADYWHEVPSDPSGFWVDSFDIHIISGNDDLKHHLGEQIKKTAYFGEFHEKMHEFNFYCINPPTAVYEIHYYRAFKTKYEQHCMQLANDLAAKAHLVARDAFYTGASEFEINIAYLQSLSALEHEMPYGNIVALNQNSATLHYTKLSRNRVAHDELHSFLIDAGAQYFNYAADITRSYAFDKQSEFAEMIRWFNQEQLNLIKQLKIGQSYVDTQIAAHQMTARFLNHFDLIKLPSDAIVNESMTKYFFPHGIGHLLGLQVHDVGGHQQDKSGNMKEAPKDNPFLRTTKIVEDGQVYTIEPGVYFIEMLLSELKKHPRASDVNWKKIDVLKVYGGIRIEDDVCICRDKTINFTRNSFRKLGVNDND